MKIQNKREEMRKEEGKSEEGKKKEENPAETTATTIITITTTITINSTNVMDVFFFHLSRNLFEPFHASKIRIFLLLL